MVLVEVLVFSLVVVAVVIVMLSLENERLILLQLDSTEKEKERIEQKERMRSFRGKEIEKERAKSLFVVCLEEGKRISINIGASECECVSVWVHYFGRG